MSLGTTQQIMMDLTSEKFFTTVRSLIARKGIMFNGKLTFTWTRKIDVIALKYRKYNTNKNGN
jgi:hypothetical protein